ncbi:MAG: hydroxymethylglutaryl-CoA reductase, degradative [Gammaproteobacteria bacterium]|jgi:hydroxymethylglutaryl-CoA reductase|nr:hydroxymethylglutaryl-CoA reductase, degradative [Gammaproteobacteria bacterium]MBT5332424.1 hydroxymethylglutaryl-CoA reductase, degradative [Gammaproteobacteria bacterium]MBT5683346.1 hydroxymethylglutaryl-CoA reductase, degradative [Gammaproteobacteria bacterium]MBT6024235.1 hydroxymethylglutaryl-CoA reductase, degradative [Gammaproteobacteria bacterium]MBT6558340.1 hydroxymethylglutaryl-CoA reductase, degradative [Gammaproteobacteria bacterium]
MASQSKTEQDQQGSSRIPNFFRLNINQRIAALHQRGLLSQEDVQQLTTGSHQVQLNVADKMIENVVGVFGLPMGVALNFLINNRDYVIPLVVEEPSIVAGLSGAARLARLGGGFVAEEVTPILIGQVQVVLDGDPEAAKAVLLENKEEILALANSLHPKMVARGGGALDIEVFDYKAEHDGRLMVVMHLLVDTRDAMGANLVNTMCEGVASLAETLTGGKVFLRILSNLTDRAVARAKVRIPIQNLEGKGYTGEEVRDGIVLANDLALADPYRAATHNKGIMNGVDAVAIATGNDWRAIEAAAHAYAAASGRYKALTVWRKDEPGYLVGEIAIPMKVGTVGGSLETNPSVRINHRLLGSPNASELAGIMAAIGLAQNFAALRSLSTDGIQQNHMNLHARSVASSAGVSDEHFETVVEGLIESGEIKVWKAQEIAKNLARKIVQPDVAERQAACGKIILLGEHAVVYGRPAIALPIPLAVEAAIRKGGDGINVVIPRWGVEQKVRVTNPGFTGIIAQMLEQLGLDKENMTIEVFPHIPRAMGLGGSSALAVAIIRAIDHAYKLGLNDGRINELAFECEKAAHGTPSGVDNTVATYGSPLYYQRRDEQPLFSTVKLGQPLELVIGMTGKESLTADTVARVRASWQQYPERYETIFDQIGHLTMSASDAVKSGQLNELGELMNLCHGYLNALQLSTPELEEMIHVARQNGAVGAKLTGGGGGGSMIALCPDSSAPVKAAIEAAGFRTLAITLD